MIESSIVVGVASAGLAWRKCWGTESGQPPRALAHQARADQATQFLPDLMSPASKLFCVSMDVASTLCLGANLQGVHQMRDRLPHAVGRQVNLGEPDESIEAGGSFT